MSPQQKQYQDLKAVFPDILRDLHEIINGYEQNGSSARLTRCLEYNLENTGLNSALLTVLTYENLVRSKNVSVNPEELRLAHILGWCTEILAAAIVIFDDIMGKASLRYGLPCWYTLDHVGESALNDAFTMEHAIYALLKKHFKHLDRYSTLVDIFHESTLITVCGKNLDITGSKKPVNAFDMETYNIMADNKGYYIFNLPFVLAMHLAGFADVEGYIEIMRHIGRIFQIQMDFLDCFGSLEMAGKIGTDIEDSKYSWLAITCMERANDEQKQIMIDCYGSRDPEKVLRVKELYNVLDLPGVYAAFEEESYNSTKTLIQQTSNDVHQEIFLELLNKVHRRDYQTQATT